MTSIHAFGVIAQGYHAYALSAYSMHHVAMFILSPQQNQRVLDSENLFA
jgi:hypothetical protein